jgi:protease I
VKRVAILVEHGFQDEEFVYPYYRLLEEGWRVDAASPDGAERRGKYGVPARGCRMIGNLAVEEYDAVLIPGGFESPDRLRSFEYATAFVRDMHKAGKLVAAICHGPWVCISARIVNGRLMTGYPSIRDDLVNAGALYTEGPVMIDENLITSPHYRDNGPFMRAVVTHLRHTHDAYTEINVI